MGHLTMQGGPFNGERKRFLSCPISLQCRGGAITRLGALWTHLVAIFWWLPGLSVQLVEHCVGPQWVEGFFDHFPNDDLIKFHELIDGDADFLGQISGFASDVPREPDPILEHFLLEDKECDFPLSCRVHASVLSVFLLYNLTTRVVSEHH